MMMALLVAVTVGAVDLVAELSPDTIESVVSGSLVFGVALVFYRPGRR